MLGLSSVQNSIRGGSVQFKISPDLSIQVVHWVLAKSSPINQQLIGIEHWNGRTGSLWSDNWSPYGFLSDFLNLPPTSRLGIPRNATLASLSDHGNWLLPAARSKKQVQIQVFLSAITLTEAEDQYMWEVNGHNYLQTNRFLILGSDPHRTNPSIRPEACKSPPHLRVAKHYLPPLTHLPATSLLLIPIVASRISRTVIVTNPSS
ncbi:hypothetical protein YC2023_033078 [Brassica napus]